MYECRFGCLRCYLANVGFCLRFPVGLSRRVRCNKAGIKSLVVSNSTDESTARSKIDPTRIWMSKSTPVDLLGSTARSNNDLLDLAVDLNKSTGVGPNSSLVDYGFNSKFVSICNVCNPIQCRKIAHSSFGQFRLCAEQLRPKPSVKCGVVTVTENRTETAL